MVFTQAGGLRENIGPVLCLSISECEWQELQLIDSAIVYNDNKWRVQALVMQMWIFNTVTDGDGI